MEDKEFTIIDLEKAVLSIPDRVHDRVDGLEEYEELTNQYEKIKAFLSAAYICAAKWHNHNKKFDLEKKIQTVGEDYVGIALGLDEMKDGEFPEYTDQLTEIYDMIYDEDFIKTLKAKSREIFQVLSENYGRPTPYA